MRQSQQVEQSKDALTAPAQQHSATTVEQQTLESEVDISEAPVEHVRLGIVVKKDRTRRALVIGILPFLPFAALGAIEAFLSEDAWIRLCTNPLFVASAIAACVAIPIWTLKPSRRARKATSELSKVDDLSAIGSMVEALHYSTETGAFEQVRDTLIRLLPRLRATDAHLLSSRQIGVLQSMLKMAAFTRGELLANPFKKIATHARLQLAILKAFEQIGDGRVLSGVLHARDHGANREVKRAAAECLPYVQERVDLAKASKTLLRASSSGAADTSMLVRPTDTSQHAPAEEMLRPSTKASPETTEL